MRNNSPLSFRASPVGRVGMTRKKMKIDGKQIAQNILDDLSKRVTALREKGITPHLVIILVGNNPASEVYVRQKVLKGESVGIKVTVKNYQLQITNYKLLEAIQQFNNDNNVHGIIVQRPLPDHIDEETIDKAVLEQKDVDGFHPNSPFAMPLAAAVLKILDSVARGQGRALSEWLINKKIAVMGKGKTGGHPVLSALAKLGVKPLIIDSKTPDPKALTKNADIIISAIGKVNIITKDMIKKGVLLISVGMYRGEDGKLHGDYDEQDIKEVAGHYTPVPGGVGPVNVAILLENVVKAAEHFDS